MSVTYRNVSNTSGMGLERWGQCLIAVANLYWVPSSHVAAHNSVTQVAGDLMPFSNLCLFMHACDACELTLAHTYT